METGGLFLGSSDPFMELSYGYAAFKVWFSDRQSNLGQRNQLKTAPGPVDEMYEKFDRAGF